MFIDVRKNKKNSRQSFFKFSRNARFLKCFLNDIIIDRYRRSVLMACDNQKITYSTLDFALLL